jgi:hypothetical protein
VSTTSFSKCGRSAPERTGMMEAGMMEVSMTAIKKIRADEAALSKCHMLIGGQWSTQSVTRTSRNAHNAKRPGENRTVKCSQSCLRSAERKNDGAQNDHKSQRDHSADPSEIGFMSSAGARCQGKPSRALPLHQRRERRLAEFVRPSPEFLSPCSHRPASPPPHRREIVCQSRRQRSRAG